MRYIITILLLCSISAQGQVIFGDPDNKIDPGFATKIGMESTYKECKHKYVRVEPDTLNADSIFDYRAIPVELVCIYCLKIKKQVVLTGYNTSYMQLGVQSNRFTQAAKEAARKTNEQLKIKNK